MSRSESVIHNIGYRRYEGARLRRFDAGKAIASQSFTGAFGIGRGVAAKLFPWLLVAGIVLPAVIVLVVMNMTSEPVLEIGSYTIMLQAVPALFIAVVAPHAVSRDLRFGLMPLYFSRPITPGDYVNARFVGVASALYLLLATPLLVLHLAELSIGLPYANSVLDLLAGLVGALLLALVFTAISLLIASVTSRRGLGIVAIVAVLFGGYGVASMLQALLGQLTESQPAHLVAMLSPVTLVDAVQSFWFGTDRMVAMAEIESGVGVVLTTVLIGLIVLCYLGLRARFRKVSSQ